MTQSLSTKLFECAGGGYSSLEFGVGSPRDAWRCVCVCVPVA